MGIKGGIDCYILCLKNLLMDSQHGTLPTQTHAWVSTLQLGQLKAESGSEASVQFSTSLDPDQP